MLLGVLACLFGTDGKDAHALRAECRTLDNEQMMVHILSNATSTMSETNSVYTLQE